MFSQISFSLFIFPVPVFTLLLSDLALHVFSVYIASTEQSPLRWGLGTVLLSLLGTVQLYSHQGRVFGDKVAAHDVLRKHVTVIDDLHLSQ